MIYFPYQNGLSLQEVRRILIIKEVEYAIGILYELYRESPLPAAEISKRQNIPSPFIYRILKKLEAGGILKIKGEQTEAIRFLPTATDLPFTMSSVFLRTRSGHRMYEAGIRMQPQ